VRGEVVALGARSLTARLDAALAPLTNVRLRLSYPALGQDSGDLYGKVRAGDRAGGADLVRIDLTSVDAADREILDKLGRPAGPAGT
jgi:hypothetical protein